MRKPQIGDTWKLNWFKHKPVKTIGAFSPTWSRDRKCEVPAVWFKHQPKGKTIMCSVRFLLEHGELIKPANNACNRPPLAHGMQGLISLQASMFADDSPASIGGG